MPPAPARDFLMDSSGDLAVVNGDFALASGPQAVVQGIATRVRMFLGECFLDESVGVDWLGRILVKDADPLVARELVRREIASTPDVTVVVDADVIVDRSRQGQVSYRVRTAFTGQAVVTPSAAAPGFADLTPTAPLVMQSAPPAPPATTLAYYQTVDVAGTALAQRPTLNFGAGLIAVDNPTSARTDVYVPSGAITNAMLASSSLTIALPASVFTNTGGAVALGATQTVGLQAQPANSVWAGPSSGVAAAPAFRALVAADLPALAYVSSVGLTMPAPFSVSGSPVTGAGTFAVTLSSEAANTVWAGPASGASATPTFRALAIADLPAAIPNASLANSSVTVNVPSTMTGGGAVALGGSLTLGYAAEAANAVWAGPASGAAAAPTFRALVAADVPALGYVTSVGLALPGIFTVTGSPVTSSGTLTGALATQSANTVFAGPASGAAAAPTFRGLAVADLPTAIPNANLANNSVTVTAGTGLAGGGAVALGAAVTLSLPAVGPGAGTTGGGAAYVNSVTLDAEGRVTAVASAVPTLANLYSNTAASNIIATTTSGGPVVIRSVGASANNVLTIQNATGTTNFFNIDGNGAITGTTTGSAGANQLALNTSTTWASGNLVYLQNNGSLKMAVGYDGSVVSASGRFDTAAAATLNLGTSTANAISIGPTSASVTTTIQGGSPTLLMGGTTSNLISFAANGVAAPTLTTRSVGTKIVLYPNISSGSVDYALGIASSTMWFSVPASTAQFQWYASTTAIATLSGTGSVTTLDAGTAGLYLNAGASASLNFNIGGTTKIAINSSGTLYPTWTGNPQYLGSPSSPWTYIYGTHVHQNHTVTEGTAPTISWAVAPSSYSITGNNSAGLITFTLAGASWSLGQIIATITFNTSPAPPNAPKAIVLTNATYGNTGGPQLFYVVSGSNVSTTSWGLCNLVQMNAGATYGVWYHVIF